VPVRNVSHEERKLIPYRVQALYELGKISKEQLDNYVKTGSEEYLRSYEENLRADPSRQPGNLAAPEKPAPVATPTPAPESTLGAMGLSMSTRSEEKDVNDEIASIAEESSWFEKVDRAAKDENYRKSVLDESKAKRDVAWKRLQEHAASGKDTFPSPQIQKDIAQYDKLTEALSNAQRDPEYTKKQKETLAQRMESLRQKTANIRSKYQAAEQGLSGGTGFARAVAQGASNWEQFLPQLTGGIGSVVGGGLAVTSGAGIPVSGLAATGGNIAGSALGSYPLAKRVYNDSYAQAILNNSTPEEAAQYAFEKTSLEFGAEMAASLIPGGNTPGLRTATKSAVKPILTRIAGGTGRQIGEETLTDLASQTLDISKLGSGSESAALQKTRIENLPFDENGQFDPKKFAEQRYETALAAAVGGTVASAIPSIKEGRAAVADVNARIAQGKAVYENIAKSGADVNTLSEARTAIARSLGLEADTIEDAQTLANRFKQNDVPSKTRAKAVAETIMTGDPAFDAGQKAAQQTFQLAEQFKPVEATVTQFEPLSRRPATPVQGNLGSFTVEAPVAKETLTERGLKKANQRFDKDTRILDSEIANLRTQLGQNVDPITGVDPVRAQLDEAETIREGIARERLRTAEKAKPAEPTPYAKEMRRFQEQPKVEVNAKIPEAPKISRAESITNKVAEEVTAKTKKELPKNTKQRVTKVAALVEDELTFSGALRGLDEKAANDAVLAKTREYLASGEKESAIVERVRGLQNQRKAEATERLKTAATALNNQDEVLKTLDRNLGKDAVDGLVRSDKVRVLSDFERVDIPMSAEERSRGQGVYVDKDGTIYLNAKNLAGKKDDNGNLKREIAMAVLAHEQGHTKNFRTEDGKRVPVLKGLAGDAAYDALNKAIADSAKGTGRIADIAKRAQERAQSGVEAAQKAGRQVELKDELPQYFVEELVNSYDGPLGQFRKFIDESSAKARDIINRSPLKMDIRPQDLGWMVKQDLIAESKTPKTTGTKQAKLSLGTKEATGFKEAKRQGKTFTSPATGEEIFEIPDNDMKVNAGILRAANGKPIDLETALVHDELFKQWPFLRKDVKIKLTDKFALNEAEYDPRTKTITISNQNIDNIYNYALSAEAKKEARKDISKTVLHEITHAIQDKIGAEMGSNPTFEMYEYVADKLRNMNNNKLAAEYSRVLNAVKRNQKNVDKLFQGISKLRDQWEAKGKKWPETYTDLDIHIANDPALAGQIMPFVKGLGLNNLRELHETYNFLRQAKNAGYWAYMANRGEVTARAVAHVFDGKFATLKEAEEAVAKQFGELSTQGNSKAAFRTFEKQAPQMKAKPAVLMSLGATIEVDGKTRPTTNSKGQSIADSVESARNFWRWFGDSKVVDADGKPLVVYKGMNPSSWDDGSPITIIDAPGLPYAGFFSSETSVANRFADAYTNFNKRSYREKDEAVGGAVFPVFIRIERPFIIDADGRHAAVFQFDDAARGWSKAVLNNALRNDKYDGVIIKNTADEGDVYIPKRPEQIKSVNNQGSWNKNDPRILMSLGEDVKTKAQETSEAAKEKTSVAWKYLQGALWDMRPAKFKIAEEMRDGYVRYIEQKGREMAQRMVEAANKDGITLDALKEAWGQAREYGVLGDTGSAKVNALMQAMRDEIDSLSMQIEEVYDESGTPLSDKMKETFNKNLFSYISRSFEIDFNKGWSKKLLRAAKKDPNSKEATIINNLRSWLNDEIVARLESLELLDDKQIKSLYKRLIDEDVEGKSVETMTKALESFKGNLKSEELVDILQNDVLRLSKVSGVGNYYRGAARNEGILQKKTNIPSPILAAMGERVGPAESFLTTIVRQGSLFAQTKMLADFRKAMPEAFTTDQTPENTVRIEDKQGKYGPLAGLYTTPAMKEYIEEKITQEEKMDTLMTNLHSAYAQEELATRLVKGGLEKLARVSGGYKVLSIMTNTANYLYNVVNGAASLARYNTLGVAYGMDYVDKDGNKIPLHKWFPELAADFLWRGSVTGTSSHELYGLAVTANFVGSAMSGDIKEAFLDTIRETVEGKKPSLVKRGWRKATWLGDAWFSGPEALPNILGVVVESNYLRELWTEQGKEFTHDELMAAAADRVKRNAISRDRAIPGAKFLDKYAAQAFLTFFTETARAPMQTAYDAVMDVKESNSPDLSPKAKRMMRGHAAAHLAGAATTAAAIYGITQAIALAFGRPFGTEDDEDPEGLEEDLRDRPEDLIVIGADKDGRKLVFDLSKLNTYSLITNVVREAAQGNLEGAGRQAKSFLFANPLPQKVWTELTDNYGEAGKSDVAIAVNNAIADTPLGQVVDPTTVNELVKVMSMFTPGFIKDPKKALENAQGLQENLALGFVGAGARPVAYQPVKTLRYQMGTALDELETARSKLNAAMRTKDASEKLIKQEMRRYYNAERDLILKNRPLVQAALKNNTSEKELRQLFKLLGANKHLNEQMLSKERYKPTAMHKNWLTMSQKLATFGESEKVKEEQGMIYTQNKETYRKLFDEIYGNKGVN